MDGVQAGTAGGLSPRRANAISMLFWKGISMATPREMDIVRRAYQLWKEAGQPQGRDQEFYLQAERELSGGPDRRKSFDDKTE